MSRLIVGDRMREICETLDRMGGSADSQSEVYLQLVYPGGGSSNAHGWAAMQRAQAAGLVRRDPVHASRIRVHLTTLGERVARGER